MDLPEVLKAKDISKFLNISQRYAYEIMSRKDFPAIKVSTGTKKVLRRVMKHDFLKWLEKQKAC